MSPIGLGPLDLLVVQPTPFCNLDCSYCYLPGRLDKRRMSEETLRQVFARVFSSAITGHSFTVVWHAGEPMVVPREWYVRALDIIAAENHHGVAVAHSFQTNATLIDDAWCELIVERGIRIGVSIDGPDFLHDRCRKTRGGAGTHARAMEGVATLQRFRIPFHVISVLTAESLDYPDEIHAFFVEHDLEMVGFNVEEIEGPNASSSLATDNADARFRRFFSRFYDLVEAGGRRLKVREIESMRGALLEPVDVARLRTQETAPFAIVSVDCDGNFSSFSPELLGYRNPRYADFVLGNVARDSFESAAETPAFARLHGDIAAGVERCRRECDYFAFCGGGAPVNKLCENGTFDSTETLFCRLNRKAMADVLLDKLAGGRAVPGPLSPRA